MASPLTAQSFRVCLFHSELGRKAPGLLYRDIKSGEASAIEAATRIARGECDILGLFGFDFDHYSIALAAFAERIAEHGGPIYPYRFSKRPNTGWPSHVDLDMDGRLGTPRDAQGYGLFSGEGGMAVLSRHPIQTADVQDYSGIIWRDLPWAKLPEANGRPFLSDKASAVQRLSTTGHWVVPVNVHGVILSLMIYHASPPVFDGPEDRNGLRNADETLFWVHHVDENPPSNFIILGAANLDPLQSDGRTEAIRSLLDSPHLQDPFHGATRKDSLTVDWTDLDLGLMRTDYILPSTDFKVADAGTEWPKTNVSKASRHALIWVELSQTPNETLATLETSGSSK
ncbi:MAG: endonuclease/exonuclease/phosphatase family protein [Paracoccaceae bacterium]|nr:endonuclease/exonuclease/phosphatase family protein [Paracoccaceae bacterium]